MQENTKCCLLRKKNPGWALVKNLISFSSVWNDLFFSHSQEAAQSLDMFLLLLLLLVPSRSSPIFPNISSPSSGPFQYSSFRRAVFFWGLSGICSGAHFSSERLAEGQADNKPLFPSSCTILFFPSRTSFCVSLLFFYFEVEFPHLCLPWKKNTRGNEQKPCFTQATKKKNEDVRQCACLTPCSSLLTSLCLFSGWTLTLVWPSLHSLHHTLPACETCNTQKRRSSFRLFFCVYLWQVSAKVSRKALYLCVYGCWCGGLWVNPRVFNLPEQ